VTQQLVSWTPDLSLGIEVIDQQHKRIVDYINQLHDAGLHKDRESVRRVIEDLVDYTLSHFGFEEALMAEAGYRFLAPHKKVHELFVRRVDEYRQRFEQGEEVATELQGILVKWLMKHIKHEDKDYSAAVRAGLGEERLKAPQAGPAGR
jgi:hemerythrin